MPKKRWKMDNHDTLEVPIRIPLNRLLAIGAALRVADDDLLIDQGVLPGTVSQVQHGFDQIDGILSANLGEDWPFLVMTQEAIEEEASPDALWEDPQ